MKYYLHRDFDEIVPGSEAFRTAGSRFSSSAAWTSLLVCFSSFTDNKRKNCQHNLIQYYKYHSVNYFPFYTHFKLWFTGKFMIWHGTNMKRELYSTVITKTQIKRSTIHLIRILTAVHGNSALNHKNHDLGKVMWIMWDIPQSMWPT